MFPKGIFIISLIIFIHDVNARTISNSYERNSLLTCTPGTSIKNDCNTCLCNQNGNYLCTMKACPPKTIFRKCLPGDVQPFGCSTCTCNSEGIFICDSSTCPIDEDYENDASENVDSIDENVDNSLVRKKRADDYYDTNPDYLYEDLVPTSEEQRKELERQRYMQLRQEALDKRREAQELNQQKIELAKQQAEIQQQLEYQRQLDEEQQALDAQQWEIDHQQDYYDQQLNHQQEQLYKKQARLLKKKF